MPLRLVLENEDIFDVNLCRAGMAETVVRYLKEMTARMGAVRETLKKYA